MSKKGAFFASLHSPMGKDLVCEEADRAAQIIEEFRTVEQDAKGVAGKKNKHIPDHIFNAAAGVAVISIVKGGFLVSAQGGCGIVVRRFSDNTWSPPAAIGVVGLGGGFLIGLSQVDFVFILNEKAVDSFCKRGSLKFGGDLSLAAGPTGRDAQGSVGLERNVHVVYSYGRSKGLYAGMSFEGTGFVPRTDQNAKWYQPGVDVKDILSGRVPRPPGMSRLLMALASHSQRPAPFDYASYTAAYPPTYPPTDYQPSTHDQSVGQYQPTVYPPPTDYQPYDQYQPYVLPPPIDHYPPTDYQPSVPPIDQYHPPTDYQPSVLPPPTDYQPSSTDYQPSSTDYPPSVPPIDQYHPPTDYQPSSTDYPPSGYQASYSDAHAAPSQQFDPRLTMSYQAPVLSRSSSLPADAQDQRSAALSYSDPSALPAALPPPRPRSMKPALSSARPLPTRPASVHDVSPTPVRSLPPQRAAPTRPQSVYRPAPAPPTE